MRKAAEVVFLIMIFFLTACGSGGNSAKTPATTSTYAVSGRVTLYGSGLGGVAVTLSDPAGTNPITVLTQGDGTFSFTSLKNGSYTVSVAMAGYSMSTNQSITVKDADVQQVGFTAVGLWQQTGYLLGQDRVLLQINTLAFGNGNIYAGTNGWGVFTSTDGGHSWNPSNTGISDSFISVYALAIDPAHSQTVYATVGGDGVYKSTDGGTTWNAVNSGITNLNASALAIDPVQSSTIYVGTSGGIFKSIDGGTTWNAIGTGISNPNITCLAIDPNNSQNVYAGTFSGVVFKSTDGGASWSAITSGITYRYGTDFISSLAVDPTNSRTIYVETVYSGLFKSTDGGASWNVSGPGGSSLAVDPSNSQKLYVGTTFNVFRSTDGGASWSDISSGITGVSDLLVQVVIAPGGGVYAVTHCFGTVYRLSNP